MALDSVTLLGKSASVKTARRQDGGGATLEFTAALGDQFTIPEEWWREAGAVGFRATAESFPVDWPEADGSSKLAVVAIAEIRPPRRNPGVRGLRDDKAVPVLMGFAQSTPLPPVRAYAVADGPFHYRLGDGFHRYHLSVAVGFTHMPLIIPVHWELWMTDPEP